MFSVILAASAIFLLNSRTLVSAKTAAATRDNSLLDEILEGLLGGGGHVAAETESGGESEDDKRVDYDGSGHVTEDSLNLQFRLDGVPVSLDLHRSDSVPSDPLTVVARHGTLSYWTAPADQSLAAYVNEASRASVVVERRSDNNGQHVKRYRGDFESEGKLYTPSPTEDARLTGRRENSHVTDTFRVRIDHVEHLVTPVDLTDAAMAFGSAEPLPNNGRHGDDINQWTVRGVKPVVRDNKLHHIVELLMVIDYSLYQRWYTTSTAQQDDAKASEAIREIRHYFTQICSGIDMRYASISDPEFTIRVHLVGFFIATTAKDSKWTEDPSLMVTFKNDKYTDMFKGLIEMEKWVESAAPTFSPFDHAMLFSANFLYDGNYDSQGHPMTKSGLANIEGVCQKTRRVSICFEFGQYSSMQTGAHELAHNLGSQHDPATGPCAGSNQFIMATAPASLTDATFNNPFTFSTCSITYFRNYLGKITKANTNCLLKQGSASIVADDVYPGIVYTADQQCQMFYDSQSFFCAGGILEKTICSLMQCWTADNKNCFASSEQRAYAGTSCGNKKWCMRGVCVPNDRAPPTNETCVYGDFRGLVWVDDKIRVTCTDLGKIHAYRCYDPTTASMCCRTCVDIRRNDKPGCEYGDSRPSWCKTVRKVDCYAASTQKECCETCAKFKTGPPGCEFGDKASWCPTSIKTPAWQCYTQAGTCCETCARFKTTIKDCDYGDRVTWCDSQDLSPARCTPSDLGAQCCGSCKPFTRSQHTAIAGRSRQASCREVGQRAVLEDCRNGSGQLCVRCLFYIVKD